MRIRSTTGGVLATTFAFGFAFMAAGCGSSSSGDAPKPISPEMEKKTQEMLKNYGKQAAEQGRANAARRKRP